MFIPQSINFSLVAEDDSFVHELSYSKPSDDTVQLLILFESVTKLGFDLCLVTSLVSDDAVQMNVSDNDPPKHCGKGCASPEFPRGEAFPSKEAASDCDETTQSSSPTYPAQAVP